MAYFTFCRVHKTLRMAPAMAAGIADHVWTIQELLTWTGENENGSPYSSAPHQSATHI
jgi:hypothetical protein